MDDLGGSMRTTAFCVMGLASLAACDSSGAGPAATTQATDSPKPPATTPTTSTSATSAAPVTAETMSAKAACPKLSTSVGGGECKAEEPSGLGAAAWERQTFELVEPKGKTCQVMSFRKRADLDATVKAFDGAATLAGPHRYSSTTKLLFVQCNRGMPRDAGTKLERALGEL